MDILALIAAFGGGIIGAYMGALPAFIMTGIYALVGGVLTAAGVGGDVAVNYLAFGSFVGPHIAFAGGVAAAILTAAGNVYTGVCIDTACTLGMCAERSAIANMITNGESRIVRLVCVMGDGRVGMPCGACREFMMQLDKDSPGLEILADAETGKTVRLRELMPHWWGAERFR